MDHSSCNANFGGNRSYDMSFQAKNCVAIVDTYLEYNL